MTNTEIPALPVVPRVVGPTQPISLAARLIPAVIVVGLFVWLVISSVTGHHEAPASPWVARCVTDAVADGIPGDVVTGCREAAVKYAPHPAVSVASYGGPEFRVSAPDDGPANPVAECLLAQGFTGDPEDAVSAIYAPESAVAACAGRAVSLPDDSNVMGGAPDRMSA